MPRTNFKPDYSSLFIELEDIHRKRQDYIKSDGMINNQVKAISRRLTKVGYSEDQITSHTSGIVNTLQSFIEVKRAYEKQMIKIGQQLPLHDWYCQHEGCSDIGFCMLMAEIGNMKNYSNPAKVWKRMGLSVQGGRAEKNDIKGQNTGYSKRRRAIAYQISSSIIKKHGHYREIYDVRKAYEVERDLNGGTAEYVEANRSRMVNQFQSPDNKKLIKNNQLPKSVIDSRAQRYMVKRLLCDMWNEWNKN